MKYFKIFLGLGMLLILGSMAQAAIPQLMNVQGMLRDTSGNLVSDNSYSMIFTIYDDSKVSNYGRNPISRQAELSNMAEHDQIESDSSDKGSKYPAVSDIKRSNRKPSQMISEIQETFKTEQTNLKELVKRLKEAADDHTALEIQREIERVKFDTELRILEIQGKYARSNGRTGVAADIEKAIINMRLHSEIKSKAIEQDALPGMVPQDSTKR